MLHSPRWYKQSGLCSPESAPSPGGVLLGALQCSSLLSLGRKETITRRVPPPPTSQVLEVCSIAEKLHTLTRHRLDQVYTPASTGHFCSLRSSVFIHQLAGDNVTINPQRVINRQTKGGGCPKAPTPSRRQKPKQPDSEWCPLPEWRKTVGSRLTYWHHPGVGRIKHHLTIMFRKSKAHTEYSWDS